MVISVDFETPRIDAISRWMPGLPPLFFVNKDIPKDRYRYSLTHELGHVVMHALGCPKDFCTGNYPWPSPLYTDRYLSLAVHSTCLNQGQEISSPWDQSGLKHCALERGESRYRSSPRASSSA